MLSKILILTFLISVNLFADDAGEKLATRKAKMLSHITERISKLQEHKACIESANDKEALKKCHESMRQWHKTHGPKGKGKDDEGMDE